MYDYSNIDDYEINPEDYERAATYGVNKHNLKQRVEDYGWEKERAITTPVKTPVKGDKWVQLAKQNGISYSTFRGRVKRLGWTKEEAATQPLAQGKKRHGARRTKYPQKYYDIAASNGIGERTFRARITYYGWDIERAATEPPNEKFKRMETRKERQEVE